MSYAEIIFNRCFCNIPTPENKKEYIISEIQKELEDFFPSYILNELNKINLRAYVNSGLNFNISCGINIDKSNKIGSAGYMQLQDRINEIEALIIEQSFSYEEACIFVYNKYTKHNLSDAMKINALKRQANEYGIDVEIKVVK